MNDIEYRWTSFMEAYLAAQGLVPTGILGDRRQRHFGQVQIQPPLTDGMTHHCADGLDELGAGVALGRLSVAALVVKQDGPGMRFRTLRIEVGGHQFVHRLAEHGSERFVVGVGAFLGDTQKHTNTLAIRGARAILDRAVVQAFQVLRQQGFQRP